MTLLHVSWIALLFFIMPLGSSYAEPFVTAKKITETFRSGMRLESLVPCSLSRTETLCALIHTSNESPDEFRVYSYNGDANHSPKVVYSFAPGKVGGAQNLLGSFNTNTGDHTLQTYWTLPGVHNDGKTITIQVALDPSGKYSTTVIPGKSGHP